MPTAGIRVLTIGKQFRLPSDYETRHIDDVSSLVSLLAAFMPDVVMTSTFTPGALMKAAFEIRKRWIHVPPDAAPDRVIQAIESCYAFNLWTEHPNQAANPLVSVYTGSFEAGDYVREAFQSLRDQTYQNWEWVVVDDHSGDGTWERLEGFAREDPRVRPFRSGRRLGKIGAVKDTATRLCRGVYLMELDHDDMLVDTAIEEIRRVFDADPTLGMVYSNSSNFFEDGSFHRYPDPFWKGRYRETEYRGRKWLECVNPDIYDRFGPRFTDQFAWFLTVGPNHVRAFRAETLRGLGGYNRNLPVADDWDLYARFFLRSKCLHLDRLLYFYRFKDNWKNATFTRNKAIQDHLVLGRARYAGDFAAVNERRLAEAAGARAEPTVLGDVSASDLSVVVPEGSPTVLTAECLASVRKWAPGAEIILVANGAEPLPEAAALADKVVRLEENLRFAAAVNRGGMEATRKALCVMNNDAAFVDDSPVRLARALSGDIAVVGPYSNRAKPPQGDVPRESVPAGDAFPEMVTGVCMLLPTAFFRALGGFDPRLYTWEDDDFCARARDLGYRCKVVGGTYVEHERHATFKARGEDVHAVMAENGRIFRAKNPRIRVVAIAKDEEAAIGDFFGQFVPLTRDFCLLDTGSTDGTAAAARAAGAAVDSAPFEDFAQARNEALRRFGRDADWVVMMDPDERLDPHTIEHLKETLFRTPHDVLLAPLRAVHPDGSVQMFIPKPFCFRPKPEIRWVFKVHEKLVGSLRQALVVNASIDHMVALHSPERRARAEGLYSRLSESEPYFTDPAFRVRARQEWPVLDYDRLDDPRIGKIHMGPLVSAVVPTFRRPEFLRKAVASVLAQDYANIEAVVVGDACPDLDALAFGDARIRTLNLPTNHGAGGAVPRNYGIMLTAGGLVAYLDDDNRWSRDHVSSLYGALQGSGAEFAFSSMSVDGRDLLFSEPKRGGVDTSCVLHKKGLVARHGWWKDRAEGGYAHDWELFSRWLAAGEPWACTRKPTLVYNAETSGQREFLKGAAERGASSGICP